MAGDFASVEDEAVLKPERGVLRCGIMPSQRQLIDGENDLGSERE